MRWKFIAGEDAPLGEALRALARTRRWSQSEAEGLCAFLHPSRSDSDRGPAGRRRVDRGAGGGDADPLSPALKNAFRSHPAYARALERIKTAAIGQRIILFGDYDADGITAVAQVHRFLAAAGYRDLCRFVPDRVRHGYGLTSGAVNECLTKCREEWARPPAGHPGDRRGGNAAKRNAGGAESAALPVLLIALDCGSASMDVIAEQKAKGIDTIVVDHHQPHDDPGAVHPAVAHLNPQAWEGDHPELADLRVLSASGLAFLLCECWREDLHAVDRWDRGAGCVLAGLGTVADVVPLVGPNRLLVREALRHANEPGFLAQRLPGLAELHERSGGGAVDARTFGYRWGPRVNASGRIRDAMAPVELLLAVDPGKIRELADDCERANDERKKLTEQAFDHAVRLAGEREGRGARDRVLVLWHESWEPGVVGIVAGRLRERLGVPVIIFGTHLGQDTWKGSGRSVGEYDLGAEVRRAVDAGVAISGGGHHLAAGVTIACDPEAPTVRLEAFRSLLNDRCTLAAPDLEPEYEVLAPVHAAEALDRAARDPGDPLGLVKFWCDLFDRFEPFGAGNPRPGLLLRGVELTDCRAKTTTKGVKAASGAGGEGASPATREWALTARFRWDGGSSLLVDWTDPDAARKVWPDPATFAPGASPAPRYNLIVEPHHSTGAGKGSASRTWYDWRVVACERIAR